LAVHHVSSQSGMAPAAALAATCTSIWAETFETGSCGEEHVASNGHAHGGTYLAASEASMGILLAVVVQVTSVNNVRCCSFVPVTVACCCCLKRSLRCLYNSMLLLLGNAFYDSTQLIMNAEMGKGAPHAFQLKPYELPVGPDHILMNGHGCCCCCLQCIHHHGHEFVFVGSVLSSEMALRCH